MTIVRSHQAREDMRKALCIGMLLILTAACADSSDSAPAMGPILGSGRAPRDEGWALWALAQCERSLNRRAAFERARRRAGEIAHRIGDRALIAALRSDRPE